MRSAAVVMAAEYVAAGGARGRSVIARALQRADEPAEMIGYWLTTHGRNLPMPIKRGVADAVRRLYTERAALRYDGLAPPDPHGRRDRARAPVAARPGPVGAVRVPAGPPASRRRARRPGGAADAGRGGRARRDAGRRATRAAPCGVARPRSPDAGISWERLSGWLPGGMDAEAWEAVIPSMGAMALLRNLRNFDEAGIGEATVEVVIDTITDSTEVAKARLFPYQVWAAYRHAPSDNWKRALGRTLDHTVANMPALDGTLVVIDTSGSMQAPVSNRSKLRRVDVAAVMAMVTAKRAADVDVVIYGQRNALVPRSRRHLGAVGCQPGRRFGRRGRSRDVRPHRDRAVVRSGAAIAGWSSSPTISSRMPARSVSTTCRSSTRSTSPATARRPCLQAIGAGTRSAGSPTPRSRSCRCSSGAGTRRGHSDARSGHPVRPRSTVPRPRRR